MQLTLKSEWTRPGFWPADLFDSPFVELQATPRFGDVLEAPTMTSGSWESLSAFADELVDVLARQLADIPAPIHLHLPGGYDSRILAAIFAELGRLDDVTAVTDGEEEPVATAVMDHFGIKQRYVHDLSVDDPYRLVTATVLGWAPIYHQMDFGPPIAHRAGATLVTGLGGGEWFSYPAAGWHRPRQHRIEHADLRNMWIDTWPQYWHLPDRWAEGYRAAVHPYTTPAYAYVANGCRDEWLHELEGYPALDAVRHAMLQRLDPTGELGRFGWMPHLYRWRLSDESAWEIDRRFYESWLYTHVLDPEKTGVRAGLPSRMHHDEHACLMGGFAQWCDALIAHGDEISVAS